jgi:hypothetical protein
MGWDQTLVTTGVTALEMLLELLLVMARLRVGELVFELPVVEVQLGQEQMVEVEAELLQEAELKVLLAQVLLLM